jgi:hypothetical protein
MGVRGGGSGKLVGQTSHRDQLGRRRRFQWSENASCGDLPVPGTAHASSCARRPTRPRRATTPHATPPRLTRADAAVHDDRKVDDGAHKPGAAGPNGPVCAWLALRGRQRGRRAVHQCHGRHVVQPRGEVWAQRRVHLLPASGCGNAKIARRRDDDPLPDATRARRRHLRGSRVRCRPICLRGCSGGPPWLPHAGRQRGPTGWRTRLVMPPWLLPLIVRTPATGSDDPGAPPPG